MHPSSLLHPSLSPSFSLSRRCGEDMAAAGSATRQLEEIEATILRLPRPSTPLDPRHNLLSSAYAALLNLMRGVSSAADPPEGPSGLHALSLHCPSLIPAIISDIALSDEETAAQALKCLGFMVYHPALSSEIPGPVADQVVKALARLAVTTTMKAIYNLGVWCISVQQLDTSALVPHFDSLLQAIIHALDNPFGSLSTTMEAMQAAMKLATQLYEKMRETSEIWAPAIYRRLLSVDKKERDMSERCLLKIQSVLLPPSLTLSKAMVIDIKQKLLPSMVSMLHGHHEKVQIIKAWGWYIRLLGSYALRNRLLINELLKIPEKAFADPDPQVKIASLVSWESLVDALLPSKMVALEMSLAPEDCLKILHAPSTTIGDPEIQIGGLLKRVKLIMVPLQGILSSNCDISVRSAGLNTWCYLLHKLNIFVIHSSIRNLVLEPVLEIVFSKGPVDRNIWLWNSCLDLLDEFVLSKVNFGTTSPKDLNSCHPLIKESSYGPSAEGNFPRKDYPIRSSWELYDLSFLIKIIDIIVHQGAVTAITPKSKILALSAALRIFRSVLKGIQAELRKLSINYTEIQLCINILLTFVKDVFKDTTLGPKGALKINMLVCALHFLEAVREELEPSILASSLYRVALDVKYIRELESGKDSEYLEALGMIPIVYMDMVSPLVYLEILYLSEIAQSMLDLSETSIVVQKVPFLDFVLFLFNPMISLHAFLCFLYMHCEKLSSSSLCLLSLWRVVAVSLKEFVEAVNGLTFLRTETDNAGHILMYWFLCYPFVFIISMESLGPEKTNSDFGLVYSEKQLEFDSVIQLWKLLFHTANYATKHESFPVNGFLEGLSEILIKVLDVHERSCATSSSTGRACNIFVLSLHGEALSYMMREIQIVDYATLASAIGSRESGKCKQASNLKNSLVLVSRLLLLLLEAVKANPTTEFPCILRIFDALSHMVGKVCLKMDIVFLMKVLSDTLGHWLSSCSLLCTEMQQEQILSQLHLCWKQLLDRLLGSQPPILFDSSFLEVQAPLLQSALDNQYTPISKSTLEFWNATYGNQTNLSYPQILLPVLDKLSRSGLIKLKKETHAFHKGCNSSVGKTIEVPQRYPVSTIENITKSVGLTEHVEDNSEPPDDSLMHGKKKRLKLDDCSTNVNVVHQDINAACDAPVPRACLDFDHGFHHSGGKQDLRKPGCILKMMRKPT